MAAEKCPPPRARYRLLGGDAAIGEVTSGSLSPTLGVGIGMGYVGSAWAPVGQRIEVEIRGKLYAAVVEKKPLYKRGQ
jgi:aminomethyltransferase